MHILVTSCRPLPGSKPKHSNFPVKIAEKKYVVIDKITFLYRYMSDPDYIPGLAHFCEHMLFLGTEKYPDENDYSTYLSKNGGSSNAATYSDNTRYHFDVAPDKLDGALDRFAQFFISPLFTESATLREINAVSFIVLKPFQWDFEYLGKFYLGKLGTWEKHTCRRMEIASSKQIFGENWSSL